MGTTSNCHWQFNNSIMYAQNQDTSSCSYSYMYIWPNLYIGQIVNCTYSGTLSTYNSLMRNEWCLTLTWKCRTTRSEKWICHTHYANTIVYYYTCVCLSVAFVCENVCVCMRVWFLEDCKSTLEIRNPCLKSTEGIPEVNKASHSTCVSKRWLLQNYQLILVIELPSQGNWVGIALIF